MNNRNLTQPILSNILRMLIEENQDFCQQLKMLVESDLENLSNRIKEKEQLSNIDDLNNNIETLLEWLNKNTIKEEILQAYILKLTCFTALKSADENDKYKEEWFITYEKELLKNFNSFDLDSFVKENSLNSMLIFLNNNAHDENFKNLFLKASCAVISAGFGYLAFFIILIFAASLKNNVNSSLLDLSLYAALFIICSSSIASVITFGKLANSSHPYRLNLLKNQFQFFSPVNEKSPAHNDIKPNESQQNEPRIHHRRSRSM